MAISLGDAVVTFKADMTDLNKAVTNATRQVKKDFGGLMDATSAVGRGFTVLGGVITGALALAINESVNFESAFAGVRKTMDGTEEEFAAIREAIQEMSTEIPVAANELARIAEMGAQLGIRKEDIMSFTRTIADMSVATNMTAESAAEMMGQFVNITGINPSKIQNLGSVIVELGNNGASTESQIAEMALRLAGAGTTAGLSAQDILGFSSALASVGINAEAGGTAFSKVFIELAGHVSAGGQGLTDFAAVAGMTAEQFAEQWRTNPTTAIIAFVEGLGKVEAAGGDLFAVLEQLDIKEIRLRDSLLRSANAGQLMAESIAMANAEFAENNALTDEATKRYATTESQLKLFKNSLVELATVIGDALLPPLRKIVDVLRPVILNIADWMRAHPNLTMAIVASAAAIGTLALVLGPFLIMLPGLSIAFTGLSAAAGALGISFAGIAAAGGPIVLVGIALIGLRLLIRENIHAWNDLRAAQREVEAGNQQVEAGIQRLIDKYKAQGIALDEARMKEMTANEQLAYLSQQRNAQKESAAAAEIQILTRTDATREEIHRAELARMALETDARTGALVALTNLTTEEIKDLLRLNESQKKSLVTTITNLRSAGAETDAITMEIRQNLERFSLDHHESPSINDLVRSSLQNTLTAINGIIAPMGSLLLNIRGMWSTTWTQIFDGVVATINGILNMANSALGGLLGGGSGGGSVAPPPGLASGGKVNRGGWAVVGERGPELVNLPSGATVYDAKQSAMATKGGGGQSFSFGNIIVSGVNDPRAIAEQVSVHIERAIQNKLSKRGLRLSTA